MDLAPTDFLAGLGGINALPNPAQERDQAVATQQRQQSNANVIQAQQSALQQQQAAQQRQQAFQSDVAALGSNPTPAATAATIRKYPEFAKQIQDAHNIQDEAKRNSDFGVQSQIYAAANGGRYDLAAQLLKAHRDASVKAGEPADPTDDAIITALESNDPKEQKNALSMIGLHVAAINPDKFNETYKTLNGANGKVIGDYLVDDNGKVLFHASKPEYKTVKNADGSESLVQVGEDSGGGGQASGGGASGSGALSVRLNNPGAIRFSDANDWKGQVGQEGGFVKFATPADGERAHKLLIANQIKSGFDTPATWAAHYAPASDGNDPQAYAATIAKGLGIGVSDKIPLSAVPKMAALSAQVESGGTPAPGGAVPGGAKVLFTSKGSAAGDLMSDDEVKFYAERVAGGADLPPLGMGKDAAKLRQRILGQAADIAIDRGISGGQANLIHADLKANTRSLSELTKLRTFVESSERTASLNADQVLRTAPAGVGGNTPLFNRWVQAGRKNISGDPALSRFALATDTLANEYAKVMTTNTGTGGTTSDSARAEAHALINKNDTLQQLQGTIHQMRIDMHNRLTALHTQDQILRGNITGGLSNTAPVGMPPDIAAILKKYGH